MMDTSMIAARFGHFEWMHRRIASGYLIINNWLKYICQLYLVNGIQLTLWQL